MPIEFEGETPAGIVDAIDNGIVLALRDLPSVAYNSMGSPLKAGVGAGTRRVRAPSRKQGTGPYLDLSTHRIPAASSRVIVLKSRGYSLYLKEGALGVGGLLWEI